MEIRLKIAVTADIHLTTREKHPERFFALQDIYRQCAAENVQLLIIAGDLFDQSLANYHEFENLHRKFRPQEMTTVIIPGNHDQSLRQESLMGEGLFVYSDPITRPLNDSREIFFLPYAPKSTMGEIIAQHHKDLERTRWILISHGDWLAGKKPRDPYEPGVYMPLSSKDLQLFQPELVFLGHIHLPQSDMGVHYPGSPCPLNISETGIRQFLILDTEKGEVQPLPVNSSLLFFDEVFTIFPGEKGLDALIEGIDKRITEWGVPEDWMEQVQVRAAITGVSELDRQQIADRVSDAFSSFNFYRNAGPDLSQLTFSTDPDRIGIVDRFKTWIDLLDWPPDKTDSPTKQQILAEALKIIYETD